MQACIMKQKHLPNLVFLHQCCMAGSRGPMLLHSVETAFKLAQLQANHVMYCGMSMRRATLYTMITAGGTESGRWRMPAGEDAWRNLTACSWSPAE